MVRTERRRRPRVSRPDTHNDPLAHVDMHRLLVTNPLLDFDRYAASTEADDNENEDDDEMWEHVIEELRPSSGRKSQELSTGETSALGPGIVRIDRAEASGSDALPHDAEHPPREVRGIDVSGAGIQGIVETPQASTSSAPPHTEEHSTGKRCREETVEDELAAGAPPTKVSSSCSSDYMVHYLTKTARKHLRARMQSPALAQLMAAAKCSAVKLSFGGT